MNGAESVPATLAARSVLDRGGNAVDAAATAAHSRLARDAASDWHRDADRWSSDPRDGRAGGSRVSPRREIRERTYVEAGHEDTFAAYCWYGDPDATMQGVSEGSQL